MLDHIPASAIECYSKREYWVLSDNHLYHNGRMKKSLVNMQGLTVGSIVGCRVTVKGRLEIFLDGINLGITWDGLPTSRPIWGFADLYGKIVEVRSNFMCGKLLHAMSLIQEITGGGGGTYLHMENLYS